MQKWFLIGGLGIFIMGIITVLGIGGYVVGVRNKAVELETQFSAQISANMSTYDKVWKILQQKAGITSQYADDFKQNFAAIMQGRYGNPDNRANSMMLWIQEKNPDFSIDLYKDLTQSVEALRTEFDQSQKKMIDIKREHDNLRLKFPSSLAMFGKNELVLKLVTSGRTEKAFESGQDNDVELFKNKK
jgi:hypothetical protein